MFHVERRIVREWAEKNRVDLPPGASEKWISHARMIYETNQVFNLTGLKTVEEILGTLILGSVEPFLQIDVPRGTYFADIGSGSGVPGIPLGIFFPEARGVLIDSVARKATFLAKVAEELDLAHLRVVCARAEDCGREEGMRGGFDWVVSRAFGNIYIALEMGLPLVKTGGRFYIYSTAKSGDLPDEIRRHAGDLGASFIPPGDAAGLLLIKESKTPGRYPRRYAAIRRDAGRVGAGDD